MTDRVVIITGASGAAGRAAAQAFAGHGDALVLYGRTAAALQEVRMGLEISDRCILTQAVDLTDLEALQASARDVERSFGPAQILIHLVGGWTGGKTLPETDPEDLNSMFRQHVQTTFNLFRAFAPQMEKAGWGRAMTISTPGASKPVPKRGVYAAAKAAEESLFLTLGEELKDKGVTSNIILVNSIDAQGTGRGTLPEEIAAAMLYLCSEEAGRVTGTRLPLL